MRPSPDDVETYCQWLGDSNVWAESFMADATWTDIQGPAWLLNPWSAWVAGRSDRRFILSVPMLPKTSSTTLAIGATGAYNSNFRILAERLVAKGMGNTIIRLGWEFNGGWYRWGAKNKQQDFINYWIQIVNTMRAVPGAQNITFCWNPTSGNQQFPAEEAYPGDAYVDYVGLDVYDASFSKYPWPAGSTPAQIAAARAAAWNDLCNGSRGIAFWQRFAASHNKPYAFGEWGVVLAEDDTPGDGVGGNGGLDNPAFIQNIYDFMVAHPVAWAVYFDVNQASSWHHRLSNPDTEFPLSAAKYLELFGGGGWKISGYSSQQAGNEATRAIDGVESNDANRWSGNGTGYPQWIEVDLRGNSRVNGTELVTMANRAYQFRVETKPEGGTYQTVVDRTANTQAGPIADNFAPVTARYVKLTVTGAYNYTGGWTSIREFKIFEGPVISGYSSHQANYEASKAVDGNETDGNWWSSGVAGYPQWIEVDLGRDRPIRGTTLLGYQNRAYRYRVEAKPDGGSYQTVVDRTANTQATPVADTFTPVTARYVKLTVTGAFNFTGNWVSIREFKIIEDASPPTPSPSLVGVASLKTQGATLRDIPLAFSTGSGSPVAGAANIECRSDGSVTVMLNFDKPVASADAVVTSGTATMDVPPSASGSELVLLLSNVSDAQNLRIKLSNIMAKDGGKLASASILIPLLRGDVNGDGIVTMTDANLVRAAVSSTGVTDANFRCDLDNDGRVTAADVTLVRTAAADGASLP